jgi:hypothetical protein
MFQVMVFMIWNSLHTEGKEILLVKKVTWGYQSFLIRITKREGKLI